MTEAEKKIIPIVIGVITKEVPGATAVMTGRRDTIIMTQKRLVSHREYDWLYHNTWEAVGETLKPGEDYLEALTRGIKEETGVELNSKIIQDLIKRHHAGVFRSGRWDVVHCFDPLCLVQSIGAPQLWTGPAFEVRVDPDFEPDLSKADGEAGEHRWWKPEELLQAIGDDNKAFALFHIPALLCVCRQYLHS